MHDNLYCLFEVDLFRDLSRKEMADLGARAPLRDVAAGQIVYSPQRPTETLFIIKRGRVRLYQIGPTGQTVTTALLGPGTIFGDVPLIGIRMGGNWAESLEPSQLCLMSLHDVRQLLLADPRIATRIAEHMTERITELEHRLTDLACKTLPERLASTLWMLSRAPRRALLPNRSASPITRWPAWSMPPASAPPQLSATWLNED